MAEPTLDDVRSAIAAKSGPTLDDVRQAIAAKSGDEGLFTKAAHAVGTAAKALDSVTGAPARAAIYAAQNDKPILSAAWNQFGNMTDDAPTGKDIATKAGLSSDPGASAQRVSTLSDPSFGPASDRMAMVKLGSTMSPAGVAGAGIDLAANPINFAGPISKIAGKAAESLEPIADAIAVTKKPSSEAIQAAAKRLGFSASPGMLTDSPVIQGTESSLSQSPSIPGALVRRSIRPVQKGLKDAAEDLVSGEPSAENGAYQAGNSAAGGIVSRLGEKVSNVQAAYEPFNDELPKMIPAMEDRWELADKLAKVGEQHLDPNEVEGLIRGVTNKVMNSESLADIEDIRKQLGQKISTALSSNDGALADTLTKVKDGLSNFRDQQFIKLAQEAYPGKGGRDTGQDMVAEYQHAMGMHAALMNDLRDLGPVFGIKAKNPRDFIDAFSEIPPEQLSKKLFQTNNVNAIQKVQQYFPEEFETIRKLKLQDLRKSSLANPIDPENSPVDPTKLISNINKIKSPEVRQILFGDKAKKVSDMQTVLGSFPEKIGPSGTPKGEMFTHMADPMQQAADSIKYGVYRALSSNTGAAVSRAPQVVPKILAAAPEAAPRLAPIINFSGSPNVRELPSVLPNAASASPGPQIPVTPVSPSKGPEKWATDGFQKLKAHANEDDRALLDKNKGALLYDPKTKNLLISASSYSPGSKPMDQILKNIKSRYGGDK